MGSIFDGGGGGGFSKGMNIGWKVSKTILGHFESKRQKRDQEQQHQEEQRQRDELMSNPPPIHGSAGWATAGEMEAAKVLRPAAAFDDPNSLYFGVDENLDGIDRHHGQLHWSGEGHVLTVAPTRSGKSTTLIVPNLLRYGGSCIVFDPKGELYRETAGWRKQNVGPVYRIAPFEEDSCGFNPLDKINQEIDAKALADALIPNDPQSPKFWKGDTVSFLTGLILFMRERNPEGKMHLGEIRRLTTMLPDDFEALARAMSRAKTPAAANAGSVYLSKKRESRSNLVDSLNTDLFSWSDPNVVRATSRSDIDFEKLKEQNATVYITVPFHLIESCAPLVRILLGSALDAMVRNPAVPKIPVLFVIDEFLTLGPFPKFRDAIRTHAGAGVRLWFFLQDVPTLEEFYPKSWKAFFNATVKIFFGTDDVFTGELVSNMLGDKTVAYEQTSHSQNQSQSGGGGQKQNNQGQSQNSSVNYLGRPLLDRTEVVRLLSDSNADGTRAGIIFMRSPKNPILARLVPWFKGEKLRARAGLPIPGNRHAP